MKATLHMARARDAYVLSDRGTWISFENRGELRILVEGDRRMFNQYGVILVNPDKHPNVKKQRLVAIGIAIRSIRIGEVDTRTIRIPRTTAGSERWNPRNIVPRRCGTVVFHHYTPRMS